jgi:hypothetical protein
MGRNTLDECSALLDQQQCRGGDQSGGGMSREHGRGEVKDRAATVATIADTMGRAGVALGPGRQAEDRPTKARCRHSRLGALRSAAITLRSSLSTACNSASSSFRERTSSSNSLLALSAALSGDIKRTTHSSERLIALRHIVKKL